MLGSRHRSTHVPAASILIAGLALVTLAFSLRHIPDPFLDFRAFYCAGQAERSGADPYREHPLHECERNLAAPGLPPMRTPATIPAPFPGFVLALFAGVSVLPFPLALLAWGIAGAGALATSIVLVANVTRTPLGAATIVLGFPAAVVALPLGQLTPFILLSIAVCARLLQSSRPRLAALAALGALLDPHVGLAVCLGLFVHVKQTRAVFLAAAAALVALGGAASGFDREWEYLAAVVPAHALANVSDAAQFSATTAAFDAGASARVALLIGSAWYLAALVAGIAVTFGLRSRLGVVAVAVVPVAFAVFGGTYTHLQQLALAIPAFLLLGSSLTGRARVCCIASTFVAAVPWLLIAPFPAFFIVPAALAYLYGREMLGAAGAIRLAAGSFLALAAGMIAILRWHTMHAPAHDVIAGNPLADFSWQLFILNANMPPYAWSSVAKAPTFAAFAVILTMLVRAASRPHGGDPSVARVSGFIDDRAVSSHA